MLTPRQAAQRLGVSLKLIYRLCKEGVIPHRRGKGRRGRIHLSKAHVEHCRWLCRMDASQLTPQHFIRPPIAD